MKLSVYINKIMKQIIIILLIAIICVGCTHTPQKIEKYISRHCDINANDSCIIDLRKALDVDYDTMYFFDSFTIETVVHNIVGIEDYRNYKDDMRRVGYDSEMCRIVLVKDRKVVYEDEYHYWDYNTEILYSDFDTIEGIGSFDGKPFKDFGYISTQHFFKVINKDSYYYVKE